MPRWSQAHPLPSLFLLPVFPSWKRRSSPFLATCISGPIPVSTSRCHPSWGWRGILEPPSCPSCIFVLLCLRRMDEDRVQMSPSAFRSWGRLRLWHGVMRSDWFCSLHHDECRQTKIQSQVNVPCPQPLGKMLRGSTSAILWQEKAFVVSLQNLANVLSLAVSLINFRSQISAFRIFRIQVNVLVNWLPFLLLLFHLCNGVGFPGIRAGVRDGKQHLKSACQGTWWLFSANRYPDFPSAILISYLWLLFIALQRLFILSLNNLL